MGGPSTLWAVLSLPASLAAQGSIPFVFTDNATINTDVANFWWNQAAAQLSVHCPSDQTGTDSLNVYYGIDAYWSYLLATLNFGSPLGVGVGLANHSVSSSRGTGTAPAYSLTGDFIGKFSAWNWNGVVPAWSEIAALNIYASGVTAANLGSELRFATKIDGGAETEWLKLTNSGALAPIAASGAQLGVAGLGFKQLNLDYANTGVAGAQTINKPCGTFNIAGGASSAVITNNLVTGNSIVLAVLRSTDATALNIRNVIPATGSFTVALNANATGAVTVGFLVINTDS